MRKSIVEHVWRRALSTCEYCRMPQAYYRVRHQIEHILPIKHGGKSALDNLALACLHCNLRKGGDIAGIDPVTTALTPLFNPRKDEWSEHLAWRDAELVGLTPVGRVTVFVLAMNDSAVLEVRRQLRNEGVRFDAPT